MASWGVGIVLGSALFARSRGRSLRKLVLVSTAAIGAGYAVMAGAPTLLVACLGRCSAAPATACSGWR